MNNQPQNTMTYYQELYDEAQFNLRAESIRKGALRSQLDNLRRTITRELGESEEVADQINRMEERLEMSRVDLIAWVEEYE